MGGSVRSSISSDRARSFTFWTVGAYYSNVMQSLWPRLALRSYGEGARTWTAPNIQISIHFQHPAHANHLALRVLNEPAQEITNITINNTIYVCIKSKSPINYGNSYWITGHISYISYSSARFARSTSACAFSTSVNIQSGGLSPFAAKAA